MELSFVWNLFKHREGASVSCFSFSFSHICVTIFYKSVEYFLREAKCPKNQLKQLYLSKFDYFSWDYNFSYHGGHEYWSFLPYHVTYKSIYHVAYKSIFMTLMLISVLRTFLWGGGTVHPSSFFYIVRYQKGKSGGSIGYINSIPIMLHINLYSVKHIEIGVFLTL